MDPNIPEEPDATLPDADDPFESTFDQQGNFGDGMTLEEFEKLSDGEEGTLDAGASDVDGDDHSADDVSDDGPPADDGDTGKKAVAKSGEDEAPIPANTDTDSDEDPLAGLNEDDFDPTVVKIFKRQQEDLKKLRSELSQIREAEHARAMEKQAETIDGYFAKFAGDYGDHIGEVKSFRDLDPESKQFKERLEILTEANAIWDAMVKQGKNGDPVEVMGRVLRGRYGDGKKVVNMERIASRASMTINGGNARKGDAGGGLTPEQRALARNREFDRKMNFGG
jgi:hypothetical protein